MQAYFHTFLDYLVEMKYQQRSHVVRYSNIFKGDGQLKMENRPFVGFASIDINDGRNTKFWIAKIASTFTVEALAIGETLEIINKIDSEQNFVILSNSESVLKGISNTFAVNSTLHITQMLKDKIERLESRAILLDPGPLWS
jgi:hypothetical protein